MPDSTAIQNAIIAAATKAGIDPAWALAVAERESNFDPNAKASKTIRGVFQMTKGLRDQYGIGDSADPAAQAEGFMPYANQMKQDMAKVLGRDPTPQELYAGHHFGAVRAARLIASGHPDTPVNEVFTKQELEGNPHIVKAGTIGNLMKSVGDDMTSRMAKYGGGAVPTTTASASPGGSAPSAKTPFDYSMFGTDHDDEDAGMSATSDLGLSTKKSAQAAPEEEEAPVLPVQKLASPAQLPTRPPQAQQGNLPPLPSISNPQLGMKPDEILKAKPAGLAGALSPLMGTA